MELRFLGNLLSIKPILYFNDQGVIEVYEKVRTEKKAAKRLIEIIKEATASGKYRIIVIHGNAPEKAEELRQHLLNLEWVQIFHLLHLVVSLEHT